MAAKARTVSDPFHQHEVLHTIQVVADLFERQIVAHPFTQSRDDLRKAAEALAAALGDFYQAAGRGD